MHYIHVRYINNGKTWVPHIIRHTIYDTYTRVYGHGHCVYINSENVMKLGIIGGRY